jgi:plasmid maintenance system killer protein
MDVINAAHKLDDLRSLPGNRLETLKATSRAIIVFVSMINSELLFAGLMMTLTMFHW